MESFLRFGLIESLIAFGFGLSDSSLSAKYIFFKIGVSPSSFINYNVVGGIFSISLLYILITNPVSYFV